MWMRLAQRGISTDGLPHVDCTPSAMPTYSWHMADGFVVRAVTVVLLLAVVSLVWWLISRRRGTLRPARVSSVASGAQAVRHEELGVGAAGQRLSLVQFSSPHCAPCRRSSRFWRELAEGDAQVAFTEVQAEDHLVLLGRLGVLSTPTTAVFSPDGELTGLITGPPSPVQRAELGHSPAAQTDIDRRSAAPADGGRGPALSQ